MCIVSLSMLVSTKKKKISLDSTEEDTDSEDTDSEDTDSEDSDSEDLDSSVLVKHTKHLSLRQFDMTGRFRQTFALEVFREKINQNVVCSPISALLPIAKLALGAEGKSMSELYNAVGVLNKLQLKNKYQNLITGLKYLPGVKLALGSRIFVSKEVSLYKDFVRDAMKIFHSSVGLVDFSNRKKTEKTIAAWVESVLGEPAKLTGDFQILEMALNLQRIKDSLIINVISFGGDWESKFENAGSYEFYSPGGVKPVPMMTQQSYFKYTKSDYLKAEVIEIPYKKREASFVVVLPYSKTGLNNVVDQLRLNPQELNNVMKKMTSRPVRVLLPIFKIGSQVDLKPIFQSVGINLIFEPKSGLTKIIKDEQLTVSKVFHLAIIDVNEKGTHATAISGAQMVMVSLDLNRVFFTANHPFLFYIKSKNEQLFAGLYAGQ